MIGKEYCILATKLDYILTRAATVIWGSIAVLRLIKACQTGQVILALLAIQSGLVAYLLISRKSQNKDSALWMKLIAWGSAILPLAMIIQHNPLYGTVMNAIGLLLTLWALLVLGTSFGVAPADRGLVIGGPYRFLRHPMYAGQLLSIIGALLSNFFMENLIIFLVVAISTIFRIQWEEQIVSDYSDYTKQVRWRLIPGIW